MLNGYQKTPSKAYGLMQTDVDEGKTPYAPSAAPLDLEQNVDA